jgi:hypothetical protein
MLHSLARPAPTARTYVSAGDPEPVVGVSLRGGAMPGTGDHIRFDHVSDDPHTGWIEYVNTSTRGRRVGWEVVAFWLPMEVVIAKLRTAA